MSEAIIRRHFKHHLPGTYDRVLEAALRFGKIGEVIRDGEILRSASLKAALKFLDS